MTETCYWQRKVRPRGTSCPSEASAVTLKRRTKREEAFAPSSTIGDSIEVGVGAERCSAGEGGRLARRRKSVEGTSSVDGTWSTFGQLKMKMSSFR
jgi:hypothetical protein